MSVVGDFADALELSHRPFPVRFVVGSKCWNDIRAVIGEAKACSVAWVPVVVAREIEPDSAFVEWSDGRVDRLR